MNEKIFFRSLSNIITKNKRKLIEFNQMDVEFSKFKINIDKLLEILKKYENELIRANSNKNIFVSYKGNPYATMAMCIESIINNSEITLVSNDVCYALNRFIIECVNHVCLETKINKKIILLNSLLSNEVDFSKFDKVVSLGDINSCDILKNIVKDKFEYIPFLNLNLCYDSCEYEDLVKNIYCYANDNLFEIEIFNSDEDIEESIEIINMLNKKYASVLLSRDEVIQDKFKNNVNSEKIFINENPFVKFNYDIPNKLWL